MARTPLKSVQSRLDAAMATLAVWFMDAWAVVERGYRRPLTRVALRLKFAMYPLLALAAIGWLAWDWHHERSLNAAEDRIFDTVVQWRPAWLEPRPSGRTVIVEIDDCSLQWTRAQGIGSWPWPRAVHADLLDALDRAGARVVGVDIQFPDPDPRDPSGDLVLEAFAEGGGGRFLFASARQAGFDEGAPLRASEIPGAFRLSADTRPPGPPVGVLPPFGEAMTRHSALTNISRSEDGMLRDIPLRVAVGGWGLPTFPARVAAAAQSGDASSYPAQLRVNWREHSRLPYMSAADLLAGEPVCHGPQERQPDLRDAVVLVGHTASGISDAKPTPVNDAMPGVEVWAEAVEALLTDSAFWMPPPSSKYLLAALLVLLTTYAFWRGEPHEDVDGVFVATNLLLLVIAISGLAFFGVFLDIFASVGFVGLCFGLCRMYAAVQRGRAIGNNDYRDEYDSRRHPWMVMARLRFVPAHGLDRFAATRARREYRRLLRRRLYAGGEAVMIEGIVERKSWLHAILDDLVVLVWTGDDRAPALARAKRELDLLHRDLDGGDLRLEAHGRILVCTCVAEIDDDDDSTHRGERMRLRELLGQDLNASNEFELRADNVHVLERARTVAFEEGGGS